jgi:mono/diheme cytochrome c family protein
MKYSSLLVAATCIGAAVVGCYYDGGSSTPIDTGTDLPCDVAQALSACQACHGSPLAASAPITLISYDDLTQPSPQYPDQTVAERVVARMGDPTFPMPPNPDGPTPQSDIDTVQAWIDGGYPHGTCTPPPGGTNPFDTPTACTNGKSFVNFGSSLMFPGEACVSCHKQNFGPLISIGGTVYPTGHESDDCKGVNVSGAQVIVTDSNNKVVTLNVNSAGNFYSTTSIKPPYTAKVTYQGRERDMTGLVFAPTDGDCNKCHTADGTNGAPGRIMLP